MSGICGWSNNQLGPEIGLSTLRRMAAKQVINSGHSIDSFSQEYCALAAVGLEQNRSVIIQCKLFAAIQGYPNWQDADLAQTAKNRGMAQAIVDSYLKYGIEFLHRVSGPFVLCLVDEGNRRTIIAIDRLGIGSLFYAVRRGQLIFASNARALQLHPDACGELDSQAIFDYLYFHNVPSPRCIFQGVEKLLPGQYLVFENSELKKAFYWLPSYKEAVNPDMDQLKREFRETLNASVAIAANGLKVGAFLSGGTDSSTIAGILARGKDKPVDTYSIGFNAEGFDEMEYARIASRHFATRSHEYYLTPQDVVDAIPLIAKAYDEPFGNSSAVAAYYCAKLARADGLKTLLAGDGGDELFGGNERYAKQKVFELYQLVPKFFRKSLIEPAVFNFPVANRFWPIAKAQSYIQQSNVPLPDRLETYNYLNRTALTNIFESEFLARVDHEEPIGMIRETYHRTTAKSSLNRMLFLDLKFTLADNDLRKVNRMCELAQMDVRYPLLDEELVRFSAELPVSLKVHGFKLRYFFKHALKDFLPSEILAKTKHGFGLPFGLWMSRYEPLREVAFDNLAALSLRGIVKPEFIQDLQGLHKEYPNYYGVTIWILMMLEQWLESVGDNN